VKHTIAALLLLTTGLPAAAASARDLADEVAELKQLVAEMRGDYEARITDLEQRLAKAERQAHGAQRDAEEAMEVAEQTAIDMSGGSASANAFNPGIGAVLEGGFASVDNGWDTIPGFMPAGEIGSGESGFEVGEAEVNLKANVDTRYFANFTLSLAEGEAEVEEAWLQTTDLPAGLTVTGGRFFSAAGYINSAHPHADDFADRPLPYQAFFGGHYGVDGLQARWLAPTALLLQVGAELNWGDAFPATANAESSPGAWTLYAKVGGDVGTSNSWQAGIAQINADVAGRNLEGGAGDGFTGDSNLTVADFVWKWAPQGNPTVHNVKVQGEYFRRSENGEFDGIDYNGEQSGWYLQGAWQFRPLWRVGLRYDTVDAGSGPLLIGTVLEDPGRSSSRVSAMFDYSPSEFSRLRLQYTNDRVLAETDNQWFFQYIVSLGAHGAHQF
jgi:hypothetical protein